MDAFQAWQQANGLHVTDDDGSVIAHGTSGVPRCELCGSADPLPDAHGWYCQPCRDADPGD